MNDTWWYPALTLSERPTASPGTASERAVRKLERWRADYPDDDEFRARLASRGLSPAKLLALLDTPAARPARRPEWVAEIEAGLSAAPETATEAEEAPSWGTGFATILAPFVELALARIPARVGVDLAGIRAGFAAHLSRSLVRIAARSLVLELNVRRVQGELRGADPRRRFANFVARMSCRSELTGLLHRYPVLARLLAQESLQATDALIETLDRFAADRPALVAGLLAGRDPGSLMQLRTTGDGHRRGRSVAVLSFAGGARLIYKPRSLAAHARFNDLLGWLATRLPERLRTVKLLERDDYGWCEHIDAAPCRSAAELRRFYHRQGILLAVLYVLDGTDIHYENLIAQGEHPVLVDLETLFHPCLPEEVAAGADPSAEALFDSVARSSLLPRMYISGSGALDLSGMGGDPGDTLPFESADWDAAGTDEMRLIRRARIFPGSDNRPRLAGAEPVPEHYADELLSGFRLGYRTLLDNRRELGRMLRGFAGSQIRVVIRPTRWYTRLLRESTHPDVLRDALDRDRIFDRLWSRGGGDPLRLALAPAELADLWAGDVPMFVTRPDTDTIAPGATLPGSGLDRVLRKLDRMGQADRRRQEWIIKASLLTRSRAPEHPVTAGSGAPEPATAAVDPDRLLKAAERIALRLLRTADRMPGRLNWCGLEALDDGYWSVLPLGASLGTGYCGPALFLAHLAALTGRERYAQEADSALAPLPGLIGYLAHRPAAPGLIGPGGFSGLGGICYTLSRWRTLLGAPVLPALETAIDLTARALAAEPADRPDGGILTGAAGGLAALLAVHEETGIAAARSAAAAAAELLLTRPLPQRPGFAAGSAGIGWALHRFGGQAATSAGLTALRQSFVTDDGSWCRGATGIRLALADLGVADPHLAGLASRSPAGREPTPAGRPLGDHSLCHGELGVLHHAGPRLDRLLAQLERGDARCGTPGRLPSPGLLSGLAGIGYGLLRLAAPDLVPPVLLLRGQRRLTEEPSRKEPSPEERTM